MTASKLHWDIAITSIVACIQYNLASLAECVTVGDVKRLFDKQGTEQSSLEKAIDDFGFNMTPNFGPSVLRN